MEGVFPVVKRSHYQGKDLRRRLALPNTKREYIPKITRYKHVGSDWLYLKLYGPSDRVDELIYTQIRKLCHIVHDKGMVQKSFFMRYADPHPHVRLRFGGDPKTLVSKLIPLIHDWIKSITELGLVDEVKMDCYNPEIERYGGLDFIGLAEELFSFDSVVASELIAWRELDGKDFNQNLLAVISVVHILENSGLSMEKKLEWLNRVVSGKKQPQEFRDHKKLFMHYCDKNNWNNLDNTTELSTLRAILSIRETAIRKYFHKVYNADISTLTNYPDDILGSVIHLHLNRLGIHYKDEEQIMKLSKFTIQSLNFSKKK
ncbi:thiopeptide-type bacteriocin biosynthesis protein [Cytobacillus firmus]|uniref:thiopeptide-type bacteriocin biosynthesis protein n=1 Tax=Cytobacillus firmus TaxID=1399 RepID=UPI003BA28988